MSSCVYKVTVTKRESKRQETYVGLTKGAFKFRFLNHTVKFIPHRETFKVSELRKHVKPLHVKLLCLFKKHMMINYNRNQVPLTEEMNCLSEAVAGTQKNTCYVIWKT